MIHITDDQFSDFIDQALASLPGEHVKNIQNVAILVQEDPTLEQRQQLQLRNDQTLFGLYEGVPLSQRQGNQPLFPDRITLFKGPLSEGVGFEGELLERIRHTLWHEIGHYYGLDHKRIHELEQ